MRYGSVCSGIEAATVAWHPLGWTPVFFSEIDPFACALLEQRYPSVQNLGDMTRFHEWPDTSIDILVGGTPCQSFSVAGLRAGLADPRGNLALTFLAIAARYRPRWLVWENVPGVLSSNRGRDFSAFLAGLGQLGYGWSFRVLDAQYHGLAQRRRRVFVVGYFGNWSAAAAVLFDVASMRGDPPPSRKAGQAIAAPITAGTPSNSRPAGRRQEDDSNIVLANTLPAHHGRQDLDNETYIARCITAREGSRQDWETETLIAHTLRAKGHDASEDGTGRGTPLIAFYPTNRQPEFANYADIAPTIKIGSSSGGNPPAVAFAQNQREEVRELTVAGSLSSIRRGDAKNETLLTHEPYTIAVRGRSGARDLEFRNDGRANALMSHAGGRDGLGAGAIATSSVRRLTPRECERLMGMEDDYTLITYRGKPARDGPRYAKLGNSMAVTCMRWLGQRIELVESVLLELSLE